MTLTRASSTSGTPQPQELVHVIDTAGADRQWVTSDGARVWISYHDSGNSSLIDVQRSTDDGFRWRKVGDPIVGQGGATGNATFNNTAGPIVADPFTHNVYDVYAAGEAGIQKGTTANFNNIYVSRSTNGGLTRTASLVHHEPLNTRLNNVFPSLAVETLELPPGKVHVTLKQRHAAGSRSPRPPKSPLRVDAAHSGRL